MDIRDSEAIGQQSVGTGRSFIPKLLGSISASALWFCGAIALAGSQDSGPEPGDDLSAAGQHTGAIVEDRGVYAGLAPATGVRVFTTSEDAGRMNYADARDYCGNLNAFGHEDWRLPDRDELILLRNNQNEGALAKSFNGDRYYGSETREWGGPFRSGATHALTVAFNSPTKSPEFMYWKNTAETRCVRTEPAVTTDQRPGPNR